MRLRSALPLLATFAMVAPVVAQNPPAGAAPAPPPPPAVAPGRAANPAGVFNRPVTTVSSHIRSFNTGPDGQVSSLYLQNGSVVNLSPDLGRQLATQARKGERIRVTGASSTVNGQRILFANRVTVNSQTFTSQQPVGPDGSGPGQGIAPGGPVGALMPLPPPPPGGPAGAPGRRRGGPVPPPPPPPANGAVPSPPPPPPPAGAGPNGRPAPPPPPADGSAPPPPPAGTQGTPAQPTPPATPNGTATPAPAAQAPSL